MTEGDSVTSFDDWLWEDNSNFTRLEKRLNQIKTMWNGGTRLLATFRML